MISSWEMMVHPPAKGFECEQARALSDLVLPNVITRKFDWNQWKMGNTGIDSLGMRLRRGSREVRRLLSIKACPRR